MKKIIVLFLMFGVSSAFSQTLGDMADFITSSQIPVVLEWLSIFSYIAGIMMVVKGILKFKEVSESRGQMKIKTPIMYIIAGASLLLLPYMITIGMSAIYPAELQMLDNSSLNQKATLNGKSY